MIDEIQRRYSDDNEDNEYNKYNEYKIHAIEQDDYYHDGKCDTEGYLSAIADTMEEMMEDSNKFKKLILLGKNHHTRRSREEVMEILDRYNKGSNKGSNKNNKGKNKKIKYTIVNLVPEWFVECRDRRREDEKERAKYENYLSSLLDRIENRTTDSHLVISSEKTRLRARQIVANGFMKPYEEPEDEEDEEDEEDDNKNIRLSDADSVEDKVDQILSALKI